MNELVWSIGGMILTGEYKSIQRKTYPSASLSTTNPKRTGLESNSNLRGERPTNRLSHCKADCGRTERGCENNIKTNLTEIRYE
jgi:hypothetical protein